MLTGIDVSKFQGDIRWSEVAKTEIKFAFIKATQGTTIVDSRFKENWNEIQSTPLKYSAYHFFHSNKGIDTNKRYYIKYDYYVEKENNVFIYKGVKGHSGDYDGDVVESEAERIKKILSDLELRNDF